jgi:hypothetical protein
MMFNFILLKGLLLVEQAKRNPLIVVLLALNLVALVVILVYFLYRYQMVENQIFLLNEQLEQARKHNQSLAKEAAKIIEEIKITRLQVGAVIGETRTLEEGVGLGLNQKQMPENMRLAREYFKSPGIQKKI